MKRKGFFDEVIMRGLPASKASGVDEAFSTPKSFSAFDIHRFGRQIN
jgi:hypothetical protein